MFNDSEREARLITTIQDAIAFIEGFALRPKDTIDVLPPDQRQAARFPEMHDLLDCLGQPQRGLHVAHVAGTSGKGSTAAMLAAILHAAGWRTGLYTNPYIIAPQERIQLDGAPIADEDFIAAARRVAAALATYRTHYPDRKPHLKQVWVALALVAFAQAGVECAVIETGMGGRFDETNVAHPAVSIITTIDFDHTEFLGETLAAIAWQKAGIIKPGIPVITGPIVPEALEVIRATATNAASPIAVAGQAFHMTVRAADRHGLRCDYQDEHLTLTNLAIPLIGAHQATNAALAIRAAQTLMPQIDPNAIRAGIANLTLPGRFEIVAHDPVIVLDVAHNPEKMRALVSALQATLQWRRLIIVFGALGSKAVGEMLAILAPLHPILITTAPTVAGRVASDPEAITTLAHAQGITAQSLAHPEMALDYALTLVQPNDVLLITGSLFLVNQLRPRWQLKGSRIPG